MCMVPPQSLSFVFEISSVMMPFRACWRRRGTGTHGVLPFSWVYCESDSLRVITSVGLGVWNGTTTVLNICTTFTKMDMHNAHNTQMGVSSNTANFYESFLCFTLFSLYYLKVRLKHFYHAFITYFEQAFMHFTLHPDFDFWNIKIYNLISHVKNVIFSLKNYSNTLAGS